MPLAPIQKAKAAIYFIVIRTCSEHSASKISDVVANGDKLGTKTEALVNDVLKSDPSMTILGGTKYNGNNGLDHVVPFVDPADACGHKIGSIWRYIG